MPGNLKHFGSDPNFKRGVSKFRVEQDRGAGYFYHRGNGQYSKYHESKDGKQWHKRIKVQDVSHAESVQPHKGDFKTHNDKGFKTPRRKSGAKGYF